MGVVTEPAKVEHHSRLPVRGARTRAEIAERVTVTELPELIVLGGIAGGAGSDVGAGPGIGIGADPAPVR